MRALLLGRVSRGERQQDPENHLGPLRAAAGRKGAEVAGELALKLSAWDEVEARTVWSKVLAALVSSKADTLMVWSLDRLARGGIEDAFAKIRHLETHLGVALYSHQEPFLSTATADKQTRELMIALLSWVAGWESRRKSERLRAKVEKKRGDASKLGQRALWGRGRLPLPADEDVMRRRRAEGANLRQIAAETGFSLGTVHRVCSNPPPATGAGG